MTSQTPAASSSVVRKRMSAQRRRDTGPELACRRLLHARGLRYRVDLTLPGTRRRGDIVFTRRKVVVFVDGCFWHGCPVHGTLPKQNRLWWAETLRANVARDRHTDHQLVAAGWVVVRIWEHEPVESAVTRVLLALERSPM